MALTGKKIEPATAGGQGGQPPALEWKPLLGVMAMAFLAFSPSLLGGFVYDDYFFVEHNEWLRSWRNLWPLLTTIEANAAFGFNAVFWRPLRNVAYLTDYSLMGPAQWWFHLMNLWWHAVAAAGCFALARRMGIGLAGALVAGALFAVHPVQTESVAWIKERDGVMAGAFLLWGLWLVAGTGWRSAAGALGLFSLALLSKESAVVAPVLALGVVAARWATGGRKAEDGRRGMLVAAGTAVLVVVYLVFRHRVVGTTAQTDDWPGGTMGATLWTMAGMFARYARYLVLPVPQEIDFTHLQAAPAGDLLSIGGVVLLAGWIAAAGLLARHRPVAALGLAWFVAALLPVSNIVPTMQWMAIRFLYIPMAGIALAVAALSDGILSDVRDPIRARNMRLIACIAIVGLAFLSAMESLTWKSEQTLWTNAYLVNPRNPKAIVNYARVQNDIGNTQRALEAIRSYPFEREELRNPLAWLVLVQVLETDGQGAEALERATEAAAAMPGYVPIRAARGRLLAQEGRLEEAVTEWEAVIERDAWNRTAIANLIQAYDLLGDEDRAREMRERSERLEATPRSGL